ncbi:unnamed protein product [Trichogramma brassicae]|uniref:Reverse transcriptase domain-containing protein n=1 Tax=Trichogramma brassicae TaxID=86971 RepID=A0A6H5IHU4_9HYME|nr:unnamed protein product [Trichogramma brassicae]
MAVWAARTDSTSKPHRSHHTAPTHGQRPDIFLRVYTTCLETGVFPSGWKRQRLVLILKPGKPPDEPSSYRPLCMLDTMGKILEKIICDRLEAFTERPGGLLERQYGFRKGRSTIDANEDVISTARNAIAGRRWFRGTKKYCAVVTLDVRNAFNSARWPLSFKFWLSRSLVRSSLVPVSMSKDPPRLSRSPFMWILSVMGLMALWSVVFREPGSDVATLDLINATKRCWYPQFRETSARGTRPEKPGHHLLVDNSFSRRATRPTEPSGEQPDVTSGDLGEAELRLRGAQTLCLYSSILPTCCSLILGQSTSLTS